MLKFTDGMKIDTSGPLRIIRKSDGLYVTGRGMLCAIDSWQEGLTMIDRATQAAMGAPCQACGAILTHESDLTLDCPSSIPVRVAGKLQDGPHVVAIADIPKLLPGVRP